MEYVDSCNDRFASAAPALPTQPKRVPRRLRSFVLLDLPSFPGPRLHQMLLPSTAGSLVYCLSLQYSLRIAAQLERRWFLFRTCGSTLSPDYHSGPSHLCFPLPTTVSPVLSYRTRTRSKPVRAMWIRGGSSRRAIFAAVDASLERLQIHRFDGSVPIEEDDEGAAWSGRVWEGEVAGREQHVVLSVCAHAASRAELKGLDQVREHAESLLTAVSWRGEGDEQVLSGKPA